MYAAEKTNEPDRQTKTVTLLICLLPLLRYYIPGLKPLMFSDLAQLYLVFIGITNKKAGRHASHVPVLNALLLYGAYVVFATALSAIYMPVFDFSTNVTTISRLWIYILIMLFTLDPFFSKEYGFQIALKIAVVNSCLTTVQQILYTAFGIRTAFLLPFLNAEAGYSNAHILNARAFRPTGLFYEPAQSLYYFIPVLLILLFSVFNNPAADEKAKKKNALLSVILSIGLICTESGAAVVITLAIWVLFVLYYLKKSGNIKGLLVFAAFLLMIPVLFKLPFFVTAFNRGTSYDSASGSTRILRGFLTWMQFPSEYKILGIGYANYGAYVKFGNFFTEYDYIQDVGYTNAAAQILSGLGIVGACILAAFFYRTYQCSKKDLPSALLILYLFVSLFYSTIFMGVYFIVFMAFIFSRTKSEKTEDAVQHEFVPNRAPEI